MDVSAIIDTNVIVSALRSRHGASNLLLQHIETEGLQFYISTTLVLEYEQTLLDQADDLGLDPASIESFIDGLCTICRPQRVFYLWRPCLRDPKDDMVLEVAVACQADFIITFNKRDFVGADQFGLIVLTPREFLMKMEIIS